MIQLTAHKLINPNKDLKNVSKNPISTIGAFGTVYKGIYVKKHHGSIEEIECAIKILKAKITTQIENNKTMDEISLQISCKHPALLELLGYFRPFCCKGQWMIVTPYMKNGSLHDTLFLESKSRAPYNWNDTKRAINVFGITAGMCYMHQQNMFHRDLKSDNILLDDDYYPKICDFGLSKSFKDGIDELRNQTICGTPVYMAPELILGKEYNSSVDVFAYALILYELFTTFPAYKDLKNPTAFNFNKNIVEGKRPNLDERIPDFFKELITKCWAQDPISRPPFAEILSDLIIAYENNEIFIDGDVDRNEIDNYLIKAVKNSNLNIDIDLDYL